MLGKSGKAKMEEYLPDLARLLAEAIISGENGDLVKFLDEKDVVKISNYGPPLQDVILVGVLRVKIWIILRNLTRS